MKNKSWNISIDSTHEEKKKNIDIWIALDCKIKISILASWFIFLRHGDKNALDEV